MRKPRRRSRTERLKRIVVWTVLAIFLLSIVGFAFVVTSTP
jgi:hypothetical protein